MLQCKVLYTFEPGARTPEQVKWEGILEWSDAESPSPTGHTRVLKMQCGLRLGSNGPFLTMPYVRKVDPNTGRMVAARGADGKYRNYCDIGWLFQKTGIEAVKAHIQGGGFGGVGVSGTANDGWDARTGTPGTPTAAPSQGDLREAAQQTFRESGGQEGLAPVGASTPDDPFGDLQW